MYRCLLSYCNEIPYTVLCNSSLVVNNGGITYAPPTTVLASLTAGEHFVGIIATYSCSQGYQLVGGSSLRACGPDGTWNGTEPTCGEFM